MMHQSSRRVCTILRGRRAFLRAAPSRYLTVDVRTDDVQMAAMTGEQDISIKIVSMKNSVDKSVEHRLSEVSPLAAKTMAELLLCSALLGSKLTDNETMQINFVGNKGFHHAIAVCDHNLNVRSRISNSTFSLSDEEESNNALSLFGDSQIQVIRNHPSYKEPSSGVVLAQSGDIAFNMGVYVQGSEQRKAAFVTEVNFSDGVCRSAYGIMVEALPHATEENIEKCIKNMQDVTKLGIEKIVNSLDETILVPSAEFDRFPSENEMATSREERPGLHRLLDLCTADSGKSMRWERPVRFNCTCSDEKIWSVLQLLGRDELSATTALHPEKVPMSCNFCGKVYNVSTAKIRKEFLN